MESKKIIAEIDAQIKSMKYEINKNDAKKFYTPQTLQNGRMFIKGLEFSKKIIKKHLTNNK